MILPTKHLSEEQTMLGIGFIILKQINKPETVASLWEKIRNYKLIGTYKRFILTLDFLYIIGVIDTINGIIVIRKLI